MSRGKGVLPLHSRKSTPQPRGAQSGRLEGGCRRGLRTTTGPEWGPRGGDRPRRLMNSFFHGPECTGDREKDAGAGAGGGGLWPNGSKGLHLRSHINPLSDHGRGTRPPNPPGLRNLGDDDQGLPGGPGPRGPRQGGPFIRLGPNGR